MKLRFSLGTILVLTTVVGAWAGLVANRARERSQAMDALQKMFADVTYAHEYDRKRMSVKPSGPQWARGILGDAYFDRVGAIYFGGSTYHNPEIKLTPFAQLTEIRSLNVNECLIVGGDFSPLLHLSELRELGLDTTHVTDEDMQYLRRMSQLESLDLGGTNITNAGLAAISHLKNVETLDLRHTLVTDEGLAHLSQMTNLANLDLRGTEVTDKGLAFLKEMPSLYELDLSNTKVVGSGLKHLTCDNHLTVLRLDGSPATSQALSGLRRFQKLEYFNGDDTYMDNDIVYELVAIPALKSASLSWSLATKEGVAPLSKKLKGASITRGPRVSDEDYEKIRSLVPREDAGGITQKILRTYRLSDDRVSVLVGWYGRGEPSGEKVIMERKGDQWIVVDRSQW